MLGTLMMKAANKREQCQALLGHCRARAGSTEGQCNKIADGISDIARMQIKEILAVGMYKQAVTLYLQLLQSMVNHFVEDEHFCYFDDMYSPEYSLQWIYEDIIKYDIDEESRKLLEDGHKEILQSECYEEYGCPSYIR